MLYCYKGWVRARSLLGKKFIIKLIVRPLKKRTVLSQTVLKDDSNKRIFTAHQCNLKYICCVTCYRFYYTNNRKQHRELIRKSETQTTQISIFTAYKKR
jgi:hypothetical protein